MTDYIFKLVLNNENICISDRMDSIHGLWPDYVNGSYPQYCNFESNCQQHSMCSHNLNSCNLNVSEFLEPSIIYNMTRYWCSYDQSLDNNFWCHEWCKHGCCTDLNITEYFNSALQLFYAAVDKITCYTESNKKFNKIKC